jgi:hypothetical protein
MLFTVSPEDKTLAISMSRRTHSSANFTQDLHDLTKVNRRMRIGVALKALIQVRVNFKHRYSGNPAV